MKLKGKFIEITFVIVSFFWTCRNVISGDYFHAAVGIGMTLVGCAGVLYRVDEDNKVVDGVTICGLGFMLLYFILKR